MSLAAEAASLRAIAVAAAERVRAPLLAAFRSGMDIGFKRDRHDIVTIHDRQTERTLSDFILEAVPDSAFLGEEGGSQGAGRVQWYVDPIDGTSNFARGIGFWCVSIAAVIEDQPVAGVILDPVGGNLFAADIEGATLNGAPLRSRAVASEADATLITGYPVERDLRLDGRQAALERFGTLVATFSTLRRPGSAALSIAHVAAGWADAAVGFGANPWDVAAAVLILRQAGGSYRGLPLGRVPDGAPDHLCPGYLATGQGGSYPTLTAVAQAISAGRREAALPTVPG